LRLADVVIMTVPEVVSYCRRNFTVANH